MESKFYNHGSTIDFSKKPTNVADYNETELVTRNNFMGMLINSLSFGSGSIDRQQLYLIWLDRNGKFENHGDQISQLFENGGWNILSDIEKDKFINVFRKVKKHHVKNLVSKPVTEFKLDPSGAFESNVPYRESDTNLLLKIDLSKINLVGMSKKDLRLLANQYNL